MLFNLLRSSKGCSFEVAFIISVEEMLVNQTMQKHLKWHILETFGIVSILDTSGTLIILAVLFAF